MNKHIDISSAEAIDLHYIYDSVDTGMKLASKQAAQTVLIDVKSGGNHDWTMQMQTGVGEQDKS